MVYVMAKLILIQLSINVTGIMETKKERSVLLLLENEAAIATEPDANRYLLIRNMYWIFCVEERKKNNDNEDHMCIFNRCGRVVTDFLPYATFRKNLLSWWRIQSGLVVFPVQPMCRASEVINWHSSTIFWQKIKVMDVFQ